MVAGAVGALAPWLGKAISYGVLPYLGWKYSQRVSDYLFPKRVPRAAGSLMPRASMSVSKSNPRFRPRFRFRSTLRRSKKPSWKRRKLSRISRIGKYVPRTMKKLFKSIGTEVK